MEALVSNVRVRCSALLVSFFEPEALDFFEDSFVDGVGGVFLEVGEIADPGAELGEADGEGVDVGVGGVEGFGDAVDVEPAEGVFGG